MSIRDFATVEQRRRIRHHDCRLPIYVPRDFRSRSVRRGVPHHREVFVDEGNLDMLEAIQALRNVGYDGVIIPDHTPEMSCGAPWHAGMAYALGYMKAALQMAERGQGIVTTRATT